MAAYIASAILAILFGGLAATATPAFSQDHRWSQGASGPIPPAQAFGQRLTCHMSSREDARDYYGGDIDGWSAPFRPGDGRNVVAEMVYEGETSLAGNNLPNAVISWAVYAGYTLPGEPLVGSFLVLSCVNRVSSLLAATGIQLQCHGDSAVPIQWSEAPTRYYFAGDYSGSPVDAVVPANALVSTPSFLYLPDDLFTAGEFTLICVR